MSHHDIKGELNTLLADYMVYYQKLRNYHWNVQGHDFFKLHEKFEEAYTQVADWADALAERVLALGGEPYATMQAFVDNARLSEDPETPEDAARMVQNLVSDIETLNSNTIETIQGAEDHNDRTTTNLLDEIHDAQEERKWMFKTFLQD